MLSLDLVVFFVCAASALQSLPSVQLPQGKLEGTIKTTVYGKPFYAFDGIPYARPPVGELRFKEPLPPQPWDGIWRANTQYRCLQHNHFPTGPDYTEGVEDCLYVNVYTPVINQDKKLDVIVYIHGGAFMFGAGYLYGPEILLNENVVFVNLNYRLGPFGFLSTEDNVVPGNNGLRDQQLALKWVKENVEYFGGNPDSITIWGMSAGGASVHFHTVSPGSKGLFHRGLSQSGCLLCPWVILENPLEQSKKLSAAVGCETSSTTKMVECLKKRPGRQIAKAIKTLQPFLYSPFSPFAPVIDKWAPNPVLPEHPYVSLKKGKINHVPWMVSQTKDEGLYPAVDFYPEEHLETIDKHWNELMPVILHYNETVKPELLDSVSQKIREHYLSGQTISRATYSTLVDLVGDRIFKVDLDKCTRLHSAANKSPVFSYVFEYRGKHSASEDRKGTTDDLGVSHADDTYYAIKTDIDTQSTPDDKAMTDLMVNLALTFAANGRPQLAQIDWPETSKNVDDDITFLRIKSPTELSIEKTKSFGQREFWDLLPFAENDKLPNLRDEL